MPAVLALAAAGWCFIGAALAQQADCPTPCYVVKDYWPVKSCKAECDPQVCDRGWGAWKTNDVCCAPGVAFPEGCGKRLTECWVVESYQTRTCIRDDRKCLQGYGVWPTNEACCAPTAAFPAGCNTNITKSAQPCWVVDTYFPSRLCRPSDTLCGPDSGVQSWATREACCSTAFSEGCSASSPQAPCWVVDSYWPARRCRLEQDIAACNRGWGVYQSKDICCAKNVAFPDGCSPENATAPATTATTRASMPMSVPAASAAIAAGPAATAAAPAAATTPAAATPTPASAATPAAAAAPAAGVAPAVTTPVAAPSPVPTVQRASGP